MFGDDVDGVDDLPERFFVNEVVEIHTHPAGFGPLAATIDLALECVRAIDVDSEQPVTVWPAHEQPPRDWMPNRSLSSATTKL